MYEAAIVDQWQVGSAAHGPEVRHCSEIRKDLVSACWVVIQVIAAVATDRQSVIAADQLRP